MKKLLALLIVLLVSFTYAQTTKIAVGVFPPLDEHILNVLDEFNELHPNIEVEVRTLAYADHHNALVTALATGSGAPCVVAVEIGFIARFVAEGGLVDLSQPPYNADQYADIFVDYAWQQARTPDGRQIGMPTDIGPGVMYYRRDHLDAVGADIDEVISDWESYVEYGRQIKENLPGVFLIADAGDVARSLIRTGLTEGEGIFFDAEGNVQVTSERFINALRIAQQIRQEGLDAQIGSWTNEWYEAFRSGTVATQLSGAWLGGHLQTWMAPETAGLWGVSNLPGGIYSSWGGSFYAIPEQCENKEAAWELIEFLTTNEEIQLAAFRHIDAFPAVTATYDDPIFEEPIDFLAGQQARLLFAEVAENVPGIATHPNDAIATEIFDSALAEVLNEGRDPAEALAEAEMLIMRRTR